MSPWGTHSEFLMCIKLLGGDDDFVLSCRQELPSLCLCIYLLLIVTVQDPFPCFLCVFLQPRRCDNDIVALPWQTFLHLSENCLCSFECEVFAVIGLWKFVTVAFL